MKRIKTSTLANIVEVVFLTIVAYGLWKGMPYEELAFLLGIVIYSNIIGKEYKDD